MRSEDREVTRPSELVNRLRRCSSVDMYLHVYSLRSCIEQ